MESMKSKNLTPYAVILPMLCLLLASVTPGVVEAKISLCPLFTSGMVLQQQSEVPIWGMAKAGATITIGTSWDNQKYSTSADQEGRWQLCLRTPYAGGPHTLTISEGKGNRPAVILTDVLIGEVWLCSGQSNMEMPVEGWGKVMNYKEEEQEANQYLEIRLLQVKKNISPTPLSDFEANTCSKDGVGGWQHCSAESVAEFSATAYFFGRNLYQTLGIPIGLIDSSWGGTFIEPWTSRETLRHHPDMQASLADVAALAPTPEGRLAQFNQKVAAWKEKETLLDEGFSNGIATYAAARLDDASWETISIPQGWENVSGWADVDGVVWMRRTVDIPRHWAGKTLTISLGHVDDMDYTYYNGTQVGATYEIGTDRYYTVPSELVREGKATITVRVVDTGGWGGLYSDAAQMYVKMKDETISLAGEWRMKHTTPLSQMPPAPVNDATSPNKATLLYNAMINPLVPFAIRGAIWYQGCNNERRGYEYRELLPMLVSDWREKWKEQFPFYIVQLANYQALQSQPGDDLWAEVREAQDMAARHLQHSGLACTIDIGDDADIHPKNKQEVGRRLALLARAETYGEDVEYSGPHYEGYTLEGNSIRIIFSHAANLCTSDGGQLKGFAIAGPDRQWHWAEAYIDGSTVVVSSQEVQMPVAVRYAWGKNPVGNLLNSSGLPAIPFRTDDWPGLSIDTRNNGPVLK